MAWFPIRHNGISCDLEYPNNDSLEVIQSLYREVFELDVYFSANCKVEPGDTVVDAGAHIGLFCLRALSAGAAKIMAFEPSPKTFPFLTRNMAWADDAGQAVIFRENALWDSDHSERGNRLRFRRAGQSAGSKVITNSKKPDTWVRGITLDSLNLPKVDFIKMDTEGSEMRALRGAEKTIRRFRPKLAISLYHNHQDLEEIPAFINGLGLNYHQEITKSWTNSFSGDYQFMNGLWW